MLFRSSNGTTGHLFTKFEETLLNGLGPMIGYGARRAKHDAKSPLDCWSKGLKNKLCLFLSMTLILPFKVTQGHDAK